jgi:hypothetical protein
VFVPHHINLRRKISSTSLESVNFFGNRVENLTDGLLEAVLLGIVWNDGLIANRKFNYDKSLEGSTQLQIGLNVAGHQLIPVCLMRSTN